MELMLLHIIPQWKKVLNSYISKYFSTFTTQIEYLLKSKPISLTYC